MMRHIRLKLESRDAISYMYVPTVRETERARAVV